MDAEYQITISTIYGEKKIAYNKYSKIFLNRLTFIY